jgi:hypothetical protein
VYTDSSLKQTSKQWGVAYTFGVRQALALCTKGNLLSCPIYFRHFYISKSWKLYIFKSVSILWRPCMWVQRLSHSSLLLNDAVLYLHLLLFLLTKVACLQIIKLSRIKRATAIFSHKVVHLHYIYIDNDLKTLLLLYDE